MSVLNVQTFSRCLKSGGGGSLRDLSKNILNRGWVKAKVVSGGGGFEDVTTPAPPENFNHTHVFS